MFKKTRRMKTERIPARGSHEIEIPGPGIDENGSGKRMKRIGWPFHGEAISMMIVAHKEMIPRGKSLLKDSLSSFFIKKTMAPPRNGMRGIMIRRYGRIS
jgi:hypothetical protein